MSARLPTPPADVFVHRRTQVGAMLGNTAAVVFAGGTKPRNYPANILPYRSDSHFIYLTGAQIADAVLLLRGAEAELFMRPLAPDDALWHGRQPGFPEIAAATGVQAVRPLDELATAIAACGGGAAVTTLPSADAVTRVHQARLLQREWAPGSYPTVDELSANDLKLADAMIEMRLRHDANAVDLLRRSALATHDAHVAGMAATRPGRVEHEIRAAMEQAMVARGGEAAYGPIVSVHGEVLHNTTYNNTLAEGDLLLADVGADIEGWATDVTRTWPVSGKFSGTQRAIYELVLQSQLDAIAEVRPGVRYRDVHLAACRTLARGLVDEGVLVGDADGLVERGAHALLFPHGTGHLLGLDVHDMEDLGDRAGYAQGRTRSGQFGLGYLRLDRDLEAGMCVTVEPGFYRVPAILESPELAQPFVADGTLNLEALARFEDVRGIRIEDDVLCTEGDPEVLTASIPKAADAVEAAVGG